MYDHFPSECIKTNHPNLEWQEEIKWERFKLSVHIYQILHFFFKFSFCFFYFSTLPGNGWKEKYFSILQLFIFHLSYQVFQPKRKCNFYVSTYLLLFNFSSFQFSFYLTKQSLILWGKSSAIVICFSFILVKLYLP